MDDAVEKIPKACEPCRKKKVRCDGKQPCQRCQRRPAECSYRQRARIRKSTRQAPSASLHQTRSAAESQVERQASDPVHDPQKPQGHADRAGNQVYQSVAATHGNEADSVESSRLFYGPSSQFAFLQQLHREILSCSSQHHPGDREVQEGGPGLALFVQDTIFFGIAKRRNANSLPSHTSLISSLPVQQAVEFLAGFKAATSPVVPLFTDQELDDLLDHFYSDGSDSSLSPQRRAVTLAILAIGALTTTHTDTAELLFIKAKQEAAICDDVVSLSMIQLSVLLAEYQTNMGRPNSAYLNLGVACRMALAMGLHKESDTSLVPADILQKRRMTLWCLYFHESWQALALGRESALKMSDISASFPKDQPVLVGLCKLAQISEDGAKLIYAQRYESLGQLYVVAERIGTRLREFAEQHEDPWLRFNCTMPEVFYHVILLTYRPFLIAESALKPSSDHREPDTMWLRQACRYATDAAQDAIVYATSSYRKDDACKDEPVTVSRRSIERGLRLVEDTISYMNRTAKDTANHPAEFTSVASSSTTAVDALSDIVQQPSPHLNFPFPSLNTGSSHPVQQFIHFSDLPGLQGQGHFGDAANLEGAAAAYANPMSYFQNDVVTTDLFNFFPMDLMSPYNTSSLEGADNHNT
ncbi:hypothetical protein SCAR479_04982 [Seiridium cardinale]|uniref:Zn(2)-C6 fungal-type domain-containing protein n=1 Tax=Seiridium cardinale TaxID=138064 RepID=A0ABR2Y4W5_9PEZI